VIRLNSIPEEVAMMGHRREGNQTLFFFPNGWGCRLKAWKGDQERGRKQGEGKRRHSTANVFSLSQGG